jgi:hypothetical protein
MNARAGMIHRIELSRIDRLSLTLLHFELQNNKTRGGYVNWTLVQCQANMLGGMNGKGRI